jgi:hypothetical protein
LHPQQSLKPGYKIALWQETAPHVLKYIHIVFFFFFLSLEVNKLRAVINAKKKIANIPIHLANACLKEYLCFPLEM